MESWDAYELQNYVVPTGGLLVTSRHGLIRAADDMLCTHRAVFSRCVYEIQDTLDAKAKWSDIGPRFCKPQLSIVPVHATSFA